MKLTRFTKITVGAAAGLTLLAVSLMTGTTAASAQNSRNGQIHIVKDCGTFKPIPGSAYCTIIMSNLAELPPGTRIYYDQLTGNPNAGAAGFLDSNVFVYISEI